MKLMIPLGSLEIRLRISGFDSDFLIANSTCTPADGALCLKSGWAPDNAGSQD
jgi:hypothetical protein